MPVPESNGRLDSWKEIARHLGRDVRTVMRWERERGLPVPEYYLNQLTVNGAGDRGAALALLAVIEMAELQAEGPWPLARASSGASRFRYRPDLIASNQI